MIVPRAQAENIVVTTPGKPASRLARYRGALYPLFNLGAFLAVLGGMAVHGAEPGAVVYVVALVAICSTPMLFLRHWNDRYALLAVFMAMYFLFFGALDLSTVLLGSEVPVVRPAFLTSAEIAILLGGVLVLAGYLAGVRLGRRTGPATPPAEWSDGTILFLGLTLWLAGTASILYFQVFAVPEKSNASARSAFEMMGPLLTFAVMLGHMVQPLGILILAYGYAKRRGSLWLALIMTVVMTGVFVGFVTDVKRIALLGAALVVMTRILVDNKLPKVWIASSIVAIALLFPIFQAYRSAIEGDRGLDRAHAIQELGRVLEIALAARDKEESREVPGERAQSFVERSSVKASLEEVFDHAGVDVPYLQGSSLVALPMAFVPRLLVPDKADVSVGQLYTHKIAKADTDTYISISHLGELYWNFGWLGVLPCMTVYGVLLGFVGGRYNLEGGSSVTRILVLLVTAQSLCIGFEGTIPISYSLWLRSMAAIGLLHLVCARSANATAKAATTKAPAVGQPPAQVASSARAGVLLPASPPAPRFPNMMS